MIRILVDGRWFDSFYSGVTTYIKGLYTTLAQDPNFEITIIGNNILKIKNDFPENVLFLKLETRSNFKRLYFDIPKIIEKNNFDYAHFQYICPINRKCKYIVTLHDLLFLDYRKAFPLKFIIKNSLLFYISAKRSDILLTVSEFSKQKISKHFKINEEKIHVTPNGILDGFYSNKTKLLDIHSKYNFRKYILYVSRIEPRKNHIALLKAFVELELFIDYHLIFIGKKTIDVKNLTEYFDSLPIQIKNRVIFIENVTEDELHSFYSNTSIFVYPSISEGFGIPPIEAICSGAKTICSNATALGDFDFLLNYQFSPDNIEELKVKLLYTLNSINYPIKQFQEVVKDRYHWRAIGDKFKQILITDHTKKE